MRINFVHPNLLWRTNHMVPTSATMAQVKAGRCCRIHGLGKGRSFRARMVALGVRPGAHLKVVSGCGDGPRIVELGRQRIMIGAEMLHHIYINEEGMER